MFAVYVPDLRRTAQRGTELSGAELHRMAPIEKRNAHSRNARDVESQVCNSSLSNTQDTHVTQTLPETKQTKTNTIL